MKEKWKDSIRGGLYKFPGLTENLMCSLNVVCAPTERKQELLLLGLQCSRYLLKCKSLSLSLNKVHLIISWFSLLTGKQVFPVTQKKMEVTKGIANAFVIDQESRTVMTKKEWGGCHAILGFINVRNINGRLNRVHSLALGIFPNI